MLRLPRLKIRKRGEAAAILSRSFGPEWNRETRRKDVGTRKERQGNEQKGGKERAEERQREKD